MILDMNNYRSTITQNETTLCAAVDVIIELIPVLIFTFLMHVFVSLSRRERQLWRTSTRCSVCGSRRSVHSPTRPWTSLGRPSRSATRLKGWVFIIRGCTHYHMQCLHETTCLTTLNMFVSCMSLIFFFFR